MTIDRKNISEVVGYVEYTEAIDGVQDVGEIIGYVEYTGDPAGAYTPDIASLGEVIGYVEYNDNETDRTIGELFAYAEFRELAENVLGELIGYVEYTGDPAGAYTPDIASLGETICYIEFQENEPPAPAGNVGMILYWRPYIGPGIGLRG